MKRKIALSCIILLSTLTFVWAQEKRFAKEPLWIAMIDNPNANYYEAVLAYETYWKHHDKPMEEENEMHAISLNVNRKNETEEREHKRAQRDFEKMTKRDKKRFAKEQEWRQQMVYQCKRFEEWKRDVAPWVQEDGSILTVEQRHELYLEKVKESLNQK